MNQFILQQSKLAALQPFIEDAYLKKLNHGDLPKWLALVDALPAMEKPDINIGSIVSIGETAAADDPARVLLQQQLQSLIPWRKGPFSLFGIHIDAEWDSAMKWDRLVPYISPLAGRTVLDVGSGNGYYGYRMAGAGARLVIGIEPHLPYVMQFRIIKHYTPELPLFIAPITLEQVPQSMKAFDTVFSMGVLYHRRSPIDHLMELKSALKPGGELVLETLFVDGIKGYSLTPEKRYARMSNVWFIPTIDTLINWLGKLGFIEIKVASKCSTTNDEQRKTAWMPFQSLEDAISSDNEQLTIEGLPAPQRIIIVASLPN